MTNRGVDLVVVGRGAAGASAALEASADDARVLVLERAGGGVGPGTYFARRAVRHALS